jgi:hypothetical protein
MQDGVVSLRVFRIFGPTLFFSLFFLLSNKGEAQSSIKVTSGLLETEAAKGWSLSPSAEFAFSTPTKSGWSAGSQLRLVPLKANDPQSQLNLRVKEAALNLEWVEGTFSAGRLLLRPDSTALNEASKSFLRSEPTADGIRWSFERDGIRAHLFAGGPLVAGAALGFDVQNAKLSFIYRGERNKITLFPMSTSEGDIVPSPRAAHTQEAELSLKVAAREFSVESLLQLMDQGLQRHVTVLDPTWGESSIGGADTVLPRSYSEYRIAVQGKWTIDRSADSQDFLLVSFASRTAPRFHAGTEEERFFRQGGGNETQIAFAVESSNPLFSSQLGTSLEYSPTRKYLYFAKRNELGERTCVKGKAQFWFSTRIKF